MNSQITITALFHPVCMFTQAVVQTLTCLPNVRLSTQKRTFIGPRLSSLCTFSSALRCIFFFLGITELVAMKSLASGCLYNLYTDFCTNLFKTVCDAVQVGDHHQLSRVRGLPDCSPDYPLHTKKLRPYFLFLDFAELDCI